MYGSEKVKKNVKNNSLVINLSAAELFASIFQSFKAGIPKTCLKPYISSPWS